MNVGNFIKSKKKALITVAFAAVLAAGAIGAFGTSAKVDAACNGDPTSNAIIRCGAADRADLVAKARASAELQAIYAHMGLPVSEYDRFVSQGVQGQAMRDNTIVVNGVVVGTNSWTFGREASYQGSGYWPVAITGAGTYYANYFSKAFAPGVTSIPVDVLFDNTGKVQFAVMTNDCGNPIHTESQLTAQCKNLVANKTGANTYSFTTNVQISNGITVNKLVYNFGDGATAETTAAATPVSHTFTKSSRVTVVVYATMPGGQQIQLTNCYYDVTFVPPAVPGIKVDKTVDNVKRESVKVGQEFTYRLVVTNTGNVDLKNVKVTDVAQAGITLLSATSSTGETVTIDGQNLSTTLASLKQGDANKVTITVKAVVKKYVAGDLNNKVCVDATEVTGNPDSCSEAVVVSIPPVCPTNPNLPFDSPDCKVCEYNPQLPANSPECVAPCPYNAALPANSPDCKKPVTPVTPTTLVNTGTGNIAAIFAGVSVLSGLAFNFLARRKQEV